MGQRSVMRRRSVIWCVLLLGMLTGCAGRKITTAVQDQTVVSGPSPRAEVPVVEEAQVAPVVPVPPAPVESPKSAPSVPPEPPQVAQPQAPDRVEDARVTVPPIAGAPAPRPVLPPEPPAPALQPVALADVYFDFDQYTVRSDAQAVLEANARILKGDRAAKIVIEGHCDERGTQAYNLVLGERRANAAKRYLQELGVPASHLEAVS